MTEQQINAAFGALEKELLHAAKMGVRSWQYTNIGLTHNFAWNWLTGRSFWYSIGRAIRHPLHPSWKARKR